MCLINDTFERLEKCTTIEDVESVLDYLNIDKKYRMEDELYPKINFEITQEEIKRLKKVNVITSENKLAQFGSHDPLVKLLYAVLWKKGDLKKLTSIIEGILSEKDEDRDSALVFFQFGRHLASPLSEPIVDQHVIRAFALYEASKNRYPKKDAQNITSLTKKHNSLIKNYKGWLRQSLTAELRSCKDYAYHVDRVLFAVGRSLKDKAKKARKSS